jgi:hypothetical protein
MTTCVFFSMNSAPVRVDVLPCLLNNCGDIFALPPSMPFVLKLCLGQSAIVPVRLKLCRCLYVIIVLCSLIS